ncbi:type II secretion system F family protein [Solirubrobacter ginsenosidimutans]|uniref:Type II secretion system F family protein n=1 Tax=Solirubrobacter ginsenosidimutans TaxID=490573 RepID=A0A9X3N4W0_9ACTN|nr:type II secretion system F family protein [Solirubrobacter ginsenosidimutans]MDA0164858.1 type II secretion system F family protein [Solirubrobacter ginsenosidimutans]
MLAFGAAAAAVAGVWELLAAVERTRVVAALTRTVAPVIRAGREGVSPTTSERRRLAILAAAALAAAGWLVGGVPFALLAGVAGPVTATALVRARRRRFRAALAASAPVVARAFADALSAGHAVRGALGIIASSVPGAAGHELDSAARAIRLGTGTEAVLEKLRRRAASPAWDAMVAGILLQRDAGGDLPALLRDLALALETAARQDRDAIAVTAQARFTARIVLVLPVGAALLAELAQPGLIAGLFGNPVSAWLTGFAVVLQLIALASVRRLARNVIR